MKSFSHNLKLVITKKLFLVTFFFCFCPVFLISSFFLLVNAQAEGKILGMMVSPVSFKNQLYAALPENTGEISTGIVSEDGSCLVIEKYLQEYNSPLLPYAQFICETTKKYGLDYKLFLAIAQQESNLCKTSPPEWHNCWGWGIHSKGIKTYASFEEAIEDVAKGIKENYCDKGYCEDPCLMMKKYTPKSNGSWCFGIKKFVDEMEEGFSS